MSKTKPSKEKVFTKLVDKHQNEIYAFVRRLTRNEFDANDLFQETFINAYKAFDRLKPSSNHRAWLYRIATNLSINHMKKRSRDNRLFIESPRVKEYGSSKNDPASMIADNQLVERIGKFIKTLPIKQQLAVIQRKYEGLSYEEIAGNLKCSENSARANVYQAIKRIKKAFADHT